MRIDEASVKIIKDSRGQETLEAQLASGSFWGVASVPTGKSRGMNEATVKEPHLALKLFEREVKKEITSKNFNYQDEWDRFLVRLDGTADKSRLGGNLILTLSLAWARVRASLSGLPLYEYVNYLYRGERQAITPTIPKPIFNVINGGAHGKGSGLSLQEFQIIPQNSSLAKGLAAAKIFYKQLGEELEKEYGLVSLGDEAGYAVELPSNEKALFELKQLAGKLAFKNRESFYLGVDAAANNFYNQEKNRYLIGNEEMTAEMLADYYEHLISKYGLIYLEDPFMEEAFADFAKLNQRKGVYVVADDLTTTNSHRIDLAVRAGAADAVIIKPNQIGTLTETVEAAKTAHRAGWQLVVSHRSGETEDDFIADLSVGLNAWGIKAGAPAAKVRLAKYERLEEIEKELMRKY